MGTAHSRHEPLQEDQLAYLAAVGRPLSWDSSQHRSKGFFLSLSELGQEEVASSAHQGHLMCSVGWEQRSSMFTVVVS